MAGVGRCFTSRCKGLNNCLKNSVLINSTEKTSLPVRQWVALWDTGATRSVITKKVVDALELKPVTMQKACTPSGEYEAYCYYIDLFLPSHVVVKQMVVMEGQPAGCDIIIGMDVIGQGDFAVTNYSGKTVFSFRLPSMATIDFVNHSYLKPIVNDPKPGRNDDCPCGSGKKYKVCCGIGT